jgi:hypothetical protein
MQQIIRDFTGIDFDARGVVGGRPKAIKIPVNRRVLQMHFLQLALNRELAGTQIGSYVIHFSDDSDVVLALIYGTNIRVSQGITKICPTLRWLPGREEF